MTLQITRSLKKGVSKMVSKAALVLIGLVGLTQLLFLTSTNTLIEASLARLELPAGTAEASTSTMLSLPVSMTVAGVLALGTLLVLQVLTIVLIRVMAADQQVITRETYTRRIIWVVINSIIAGIIIGVLTMVGFVFLIIPGLFLTVSLLFTTVYIADQDENVLTAIRDSWHLASGNRWRLFGLYFVVLGTFLAISFGSDFVLPSESSLSLIIFTIINTIMIVYMMAVITDAYRQLLRQDQLESNDELNVGSTASP